VAAADAACDAAAVAGPCRGNVARYGTFVAVDGRAGSAAGGQDLLPGKDDWAVSLDGWVEPPSPDRAGTSRSPQDFSFILNLHLHLMYSRCNVNLYLL